MCSLLWVMHSYLSMNMCLTLGGSMYSSLHHSKEAYYPRSISVSVSTTQISTEEMITFKHIFNAQNMWKTRMNWLHDVYVHGGPWNVFVSGETVRNVCSKWVSLCTWKHALTVTSCTTTDFSHAHACTEPNPASASPKTRLIPSYYQTYCCVLLFRCLPTYCICGICDLDMVHVDPLCTALQSDVQL